MQTPHQEATVKFAYLWLATVLGISLWGAGSSSGEPPEKAPQIIILKLDDVTWRGGRGDVPVSPRWQRVTDFIEKNNLKASYGIIGWSLEQNNPAYFAWIKALHDKGTIEFWNHGYRDRKSEDKTGEFEGPYDEQKTALEKTQRLAKEKLGIELRVFGPHWSGTNADTAKALEGIPEIKMCFYDPKGARQFVFERVLVLENPTFVPDFERFKQLYEKNAKDKGCLALQGHPDAWDDKRWEGFVKIVEFLKSRGCVFMTPSEYLEKAASR
jgi:peptidoglycan/xylan/chitin deacetylase (PgdA/CDA1 family)